MDPKSVFPRWLNEFRRAERLRSQIYLHGNLYDTYFFPSNFNAAASESDLSWTRFKDVRGLLQRYLEMGGYDPVVYFDLVDGFEVFPEGRQGEFLKWLVEAEKKLRPGDQAKGASSIDTLKTFKSLEELKAKPQVAMAAFRALMRQQERAAAGIINFGSRLATNPGQLADAEKPLYLQLLKAAQEANTRADGKRNLLVVLCDKLSDVPAWLLLDNPLTKGIELKKPDRSERGRFFETQQAKFFQEGAPVKMPDTRNVFMDLTDGFTTREMENLVTVSQAEKIHVNDMARVVDLFKYGERESLWERLSPQTLATAEEKLKKRVMGQDSAVRRAIEIVRRAKLGLHNIDQRRSNKPKGVLFFAGPTGTGKTELAKSLASLIFNDEEAIIRFDMSEYNESHSDQKLIGAPPGYVGYEEGGQLTRRVREKPFSIILFDEIEKAHPIIFDKFLQILDDGRLTDGKGETTYFGESLIIFTSNLGMYREVEDGSGFRRREPNVQIEDSYESMKQKIMHEIEDFFALKLNRPEILNRFGDNFVVFDFIRKETGVDRAILLKALTNIQRNLAEQKRIEMSFDDAFVDEFLTALVQDNLKNGGRGINNRVETHVKNGIGNYLFEKCNPEGIEGTRFRLVMERDGKGDDKRARVAFLAA